MKEKRGELVNGCFRTLLLGVLVLWGVKVLATDSPVQKYVRHYNPRALSSTDEINVLKDAGFEEENFRDFWSDSVFASGDAVAESMKVDGYDTTESFTGEASALIDASKTTGTADKDQLFGWLKQDLKCRKATDDLKTFRWIVKVYFIDHDESMSQEFGFILRGIHNQLWYDIVGSSVDPKQRPDNDSTKIIWFYMPLENKWDSLRRDVYNDWLSEFPFTKDTIRTVYVWGAGMFWGGKWYGQRTYFDDLEFIALKYYDPAVLSVDVPDTVDGECIPKAEVINYGKVNIEFQVNCVIKKDGEVVYTSSKSVSAGKNEIKEVEFDKWEVASTGLYRLLVYTSYEDDEDNSNDSLEIDIYGKGKFCDPAVVSIDIPDTLYVNHTYTPKATVTNYGDVKAYFETDCIIRKGGSIVYTDVKNIDAGKNEQKEISFKSWTVNGAGTYNLLVYVYHPEDKNHSNDSLERSIEGVMGILEKSSQKEIQFSLLPLSKGYVVMSYNIPYKRELRIYDATGRVIKSLFLKGKGRLYFKAETGVYFYQLGKRAPEKFILLK